MSQRMGMSLRGCALPVMVTLLLASVNAQAALYTVICQGLGGEAGYDEQFAAQVAALRRAAVTLSGEAGVQALAGKECTREALGSRLKKLGGSMSADDRLALYLVGHGSFDGDEYRFNMPGPDVTGHELQAWLNALPARDQLIVATGSSSGALQDLLKSPTRVVVTGTRGGSERNATRFGAEYIAALTDPAADADKNGTVTAQEAFEFAQKRVQDFYQREVRIASEHAVLNGERAARFTVARVGGDAHQGGAGDAGGLAAAGSSDSPERQKLTDAIDALRLRKSELGEEAYNAQLEALLLKLAALDTAAPLSPDGAGKSPGTTP